MGEQQEKKEKAIEALRSYAQCPGNSPYYDSRYLSDDLLGAGNRFSNQCLYKTVKDLVKGLENEGVEQVVYKRESASDFVHWRLGKS